MFVRDTHKFNSENGKGGAQRRKTITNVNTICTKPTPNAAFA